MKIYKEFKLKNGKKLVVRSVEPEDARAQLENYKKDVKSFFICKGEMA